MYNHSGANMHPLSCCARNNMISSGAIINIHRGLPIMSRNADLDMMAAINACDYTKFMDALNLGADINYISTHDDFISGNEETTPLIEASFRNSDEIFDYLVQQNNIRVNAQNKNGSSAILLAAMAGRKDRIEKLIARGASLLDSDADGWNVIDHARAGQHDHLVPWLAQQISIQKA